MIELVVVVVVVGVMCVLIAISFCSRSCSASCIVVVVGALRSKPADCGEPLEGRVAFSEIFLTKRGMSSEAMVLKILFLLEEDEKSNTEVERDEKMLW